MTHVDIPRSYKTSADMAHQRLNFSSAVTWIRTWVSSATTRGTDHYTITAIASTDTISNQLFAHRLALDVNRSYDIMGHILFFNLEPTLNQHRNNVSGIFYLHMQAVALFNLYFVK